MRRHRRLVLIDRVIPFLAAFVGLVALAGAVIVQLGASAQNERVAEELAQMRVLIDRLSQRADTLDAAADDGTVEGLLALQERMNRMEEAWAARPAPSASAAVATPGEDDPAREIDPSWPTEDCIPTGTRFMVMPGDSYAICRSPAVVAVGAITGDAVVLTDGGTILETGVGALAGTTCTATVLSADVEGFAEMRVTCR